MAENLSYTTVHSVENDLELYKSAVMYYSSTRVLRGLNPSLLRVQLINLLALYLKCGYSKETKKSAEKILKIEEGTINTYNKDLKDAGYLVDDVMSKHTKHLNTELTDLKEALETTKNTTKNFYLFHTVFAIKIDAHG